MASIAVIGAIAATVGALSGTGVVTGAMVAIRRKFKERRDGSTIICSIGEFLNCLEEAAHFIVQREVGLYDHHMVIGNISKYTDSKGDVVHIEFYVFEFSDPEGDKKNAHIRSRMIVLKKDWLGRWKVEDEDGVTKEEDTFVFNIKKKKLRYVNRRHWAKKHYPQTHSERVAVVAKAKANSVGKLLKGTYHLWTNNCEHVVRYWLTGKGYSTQTTFPWRRKYREKLE